MLSSRDCDGFGQFAGSYSVFPVLKYPFRDSSASPRTVRVMVPPASSAQPIPTQLPTSSTLMPPAWYFSAIGSESVRPCAVNSGIEMSGTPVYRLTGTSPNFPNDAALGDGIVTRIEP